MKEDHLDIAARSFRGGGAVGHSIERYGSVMAREDVSIFFVVV